MADFKLDIQRQWTAQLPFVAYHLPKTNRIKVVFQDDSELRRLQSYDQSGFIFSTFQSSSKPIVFLEANSSVVKYELIDIKSPTATKFTIKESKTKKERYLELVESAKRDIEKGELRKVVVSRSMSTEYTLEQPEELLLNMIHFYPEAFSYVWFHPEIGLWAGASPEILVKTYRSKMQTMALAGTKPVNDNRDWTEKEKDEQQIVTDEIVKALKNHAKHVNVSERTTDRAGDLYHLRTDISAISDPSKFGLVLKDLHPTPAVCGLPKDKAFAFLNANENYDRQFYTGFFGELNLPEITQRSKRTKNQEHQAYQSIVRTSQLYVNLRCLHYKDNKISIYVGAGITENSIPEEEWLETVNKSKTMLKVL